MKTFLPKPRSKTQISETSTKLSGSPATSFEPCSSAYAARVCFDVILQEVEKEENKFKFEESASAAAFPPSPHLGRMVRAVGEGTRACLCLCFLFTCK